LAGEADVLLNCAEDLKVPSNPPSAIDVLQESRNRLQEAERLRQQHEYARAQSICETLLDRYPDYMGALHTLGLIFADQGNYEQALDCLVRAVMLNAQSWTTLVALATVYMQLGAFEMAEHTLEQAQAIRQDDPHVLVAVGDLCREQREYARACDVYRRALAFDANLAPAAIGLAWSYANIGAHTEAAEIFEGLIKRGVRTAEPIRGLANLPASAVKLDLLAAVEKVVREPGEDERSFEASVLFFKAMALDRAGRNQEAWKYLLQANGMVFARTRAAIPRLSEIRSTSVAALRDYHAPRAEDDGRYPISLFILGPSGSGKTALEELAGTFDMVKRGYESPIVEAAVRRTSQASNLLTISLLKHLPPSLYPLFREVYFKDLARRVGSQKVFTNTLATCIHDTAHIASVLPNARFIFLKRDLEDNLLRIFMRNYTSGNPYAFDLKSARDHILWFNEMIDLAAEKFRDVARVIRYEDMVRNPISAVRVIAELCEQPMPDKSTNIKGDVGCAVPYRDFIAAELKS
jgi:tetratricopeptide (TPR) repeat protein